LENKRIRNSGTSANPASQVSVVVAIILVWPAFNLKGDRTWMSTVITGADIGWLALGARQEDLLFIRFCGPRFVRQIPMEVRYDCF
jgi:hypothetical protein